ncbi:hypothetical protein GCK72_001867 [Caenorhabditis remanei]|uniref:Uncharacterized protein n=1 Tax=Caenorhabditis remanei TaxID=31234 RepID=A0A6A5HPA1_CAERE|nr:hypothetical protein GCK72_001867 [Caenorhabditis remanei]KAF1770050.1 hypothetical protein GCK72_001867 [Caenorhabditis remanei]
MVRRLERQVKSSDFFIKTLWKNVESELVLLWGSEFGPELNLSENLISEGVGHDEGRMSGGTSKVDKASLGKKDDMTSVLESSSLCSFRNYLWLDGVFLGGVGVEPLDVNLAIEVSNIADDGVIWKKLEVLSGDNILASGGGDNDIGLWSSLLEGGNFVSFHGGLKSIDWIDFGDDNTRTESLERGGRSLSDVSVSSNNGNLSSEHDISSTFDSVWERLTNSVQVVELGLGNRVIDIDCWNLEISLCEHLGQVVNSGGGFLRKSTDSRKVLGVLGVNQVGQIASIVEDHVEWLPILEDDGLLNAPFVFLVGFSLPGVNWNSGFGDSGSCVILSGEDVAG